MPDGSMPDIPAPYHETRLSADEVIDIAGRLQSVKGILDTNNFGFIDTTEKEHVTLGMINTGERERTIARFDLGQI